jgi:hypothetical protein
MKVAAGDGRQVVAVCGLTVLAVFLLGHWIFGWEWSASASTGSVASSIRSSIPAPGKTKANKFDPMDPTLHLSRLALAEREVYKGRGRNIFGSYGEDQRGKTASQPPAPVPPATQGTPPPRISLKFFGVARISGWPRRACLSQEGDIFIGGAGDIVDRRYKVLRIGDFAVDVQDLLGNDTYTLTLQR